MISTSVLFLSACAVAAVAQPYEYGAWNLPYGNQHGFPQFGMNFANVNGWFPKPQNNGPWISTVDGVYKVVVKAENYKVDDLKVKIKDNSVGLKGDIMGSDSSSFSYSYTFPQDGNANQASAVLTSNGYLIVNIPLTGYAGNVERFVPITASDVVYKRSD